jgi:hypothetical protein
MKMVNLPKTVLHVYNKGMKWEKQTKLQVGGKSDTKSLIYRTLQHDAAV